MHRLEKKQFIESYWEKAESGRKRKYYALTTKGAAHLKERRKQWHELIGAMEGLGLMDRKEG